MNMMYDKLVSVIIPSYNRENTIERAVKSVLDQTYSNLEVIVVDDCSKDRTKEVVEGIDDPRVRYCVLPTNSGACVARNHGVSVAAGEIVAFQDSDDVWHTDKLEKQLAFMLDNGYEFVSCGFVRIDDSGNEQQVGLVDIPEDPKLLWCRLLDNNWISTQTIVCYKYCFEKIGFDRNIKRYQDWDLSLQAAEHFRLGTLNECLVDAYLQDNSITLRVVDPSLKTAIIRKHQSFVDENNAAMVAQYYKSLADAERSTNHLDASKYYWKSFLKGKSVKALACCLLSAVGYFKK